MTSSRLGFFFAGFVALAAGLVLGAVPAECVGCLKAHYWRIDKDDWKLSGRPAFPENGLVDDRWNVGLAFSGGGTRSATATLGQLRGLRQNGWLDHVRYISAVSGGAWTSIPFTYTKRTLEDFIGKYEPPDTLTVEAVEHLPNGSMARAIVNSSLLAAGMPEGAAIGAEAYNRQHSIKLLSQLLGLTNRIRRESDRLDKTYARLLGGVFIDGKKNEELIEPGSPSSARLFSWNTATADAMSANGQLSFVVAGPKRPFLIVSSTMVSMRSDYEYPLLMPVEYTPLYVGMRQQFGGRFGGSYVWPWAYDPVAVGAAVDGTISVKYDDAHRFTLADVAASTGAAPALATILGASFPEPYKSKVQLGAQFFPAFKHFGVQGNGEVTLTERLPHADGGAGDNLGVMPLLARQVADIMVFINTETRWAENNDDLRSLFLSVNPPGLSGDKRYNAVFKESLHATVVDALAGARSRGEPQVFCDTDWDVLANHHYGVREYHHLNICFFYNASSDRWEEEFKSDAARNVLALVKSRPTSKGDAKNLGDFPWFGTFGQNKPNLIKLTTTQVNLLSNLAAWTVANPATAAMIQHTMKAELTCPDKVTCRP